MTGQAAPDEVVSLEVPARHLGAVLSLLRAFEEGAAIGRSPQCERPYRVLLEMLQGDPATSFELKRRLQVDALRDPVDSLRDAEALRLVALAKLIGQPDGGDAG
jgi:hypothetical protein